MAARNPNGPPLETAMGSVYIYIYYIISLRAAFVPLAPRYNIYEPIYTYTKTYTYLVYRPSGSGNQKRVGAARDLPAPRQRFIR